MKILHIIPNLSKGGAERLVLDTCIALQQKGHDVKLLTLYPENSYTFLTQIIPNQVVKTSISLSLWKKNNIDVHELQQIINDFQPDVIHTHLFEAEINLAFCEIPKQTKRVVHFHDNMIQMKLFSWNTLLKKNRITNFYERFLVLKNLRKQTLAIGISKDTTNYIKTNLPNTISGAQLLNAIDTKRFIPKESAETKKNQLIMIGSLVPKKGQDLAIQTIAILKKRGIIVSLIFLGDGLSKQTLLELSNDLGLTNMVTFNGLVDFPETYLQNAIIYLHTASYEPFGLVLLEAMSCGLPVVCTDGYGNRDLIQEGKNGFMIWERDPELIADKIQYLLENETERKRMGEEAHRFAQNFGMEQYVDKLINFYTLN